MRAFNPALDPVVYSHSAAAAARTPRRRCRRSSIGAPSYSNHAIPSPAADDAFLHDPLTFGYENTYNWFMRNMSDTYGYMQTVPYMVNPGNHGA